MSFNVTFQTVEDANVFASKAGLGAQTTSVVEIADNLFTYAMRQTGSSVAFTGSSIRLLVPSANLSSCPEHTVVSTEGDFTLIETSDPVATYEACSGKVDCVDAPIKLLSSLPGTPVIIPNDWARRRLSNRFRPYQEYKTFEINTTNKPVVFVVDSGISQHPELGSVEIVNYAKLPFCSSFEDNIGHGTAVSSCIVGENIGITQNVSLYNYKVFDGSTKPTVLQLGQVIDDIKTFKQNNPEKNVTINASWTASYSPYLNNKFLEALSAGVVVVCAAGNAADDVSNYTPAGLPEVITVGAIDDDDIIAGFNSTATADGSITSPYGQTLDMFAPGVDVDVASIDGNYIRSYGTSYSAAYVSAAVSLIQSISQTPPNYAQVLNLLLTTSLKGSVLFNRENFSSNQNKIVQLINGDGLPNSEVFIGAFCDSYEKIIVDINKFAFNYTSNIVGQEVSYTISWEDPAQEQKYAEFLEFDSATCGLVINRPTTALSEGVEFEKVYLTFTKTTNYSTEYSSKFFFYITESDQVPAIVINDLDSNEHLDASSNFTPAPFYNPTIKP